MSSSSPSIVNQKQQAHQAPDAAAGEEESSSAQNDNTTGVVMLLRSEHWKIDGPAAHTQIQRHMARRNLQVQLEPNETFPAGSFLWQHQPIAPPVEVDGNNTPPPPPFLFGVIVERIRYKELANLISPDETYSPMTKLQVMQRKLEATGFSKRVLIIEGSLDDRRAFNGLDAHLRAIQEKDSSLMLRHTKTTKESTDILKSMHRQLVDKVKAHQEEHPHPSTSRPSAARHTHRDLKSKVDSAMQSGLFHLQLCIQRHCQESSPPSADNHSNPVTLDRTASRAAEAIWAQFLQPHPREGAAPPRQSFELHTAKNEWNDAKIVIQLLLMRHEDHGSMSASSSAIRYPRALLDIVTAAKVANSFVEAFKVDSWRLPPHTIVNGASSGRSSSYQGGGAPPIPPAVRAQFAVVRDTEEESPPRKPKMAFKSVYYESLVAARAALNNTQGNTGSTSRKRPYQDIPPIFEHSPDDECSIPKENSFVSFLWNRVNRKPLYRVGRVVNHKGRTLFYNDDEGIRKKDRVQSILIRLTKQEFQAGTIRARPDLALNARCYDHEIKKWCTIKKIHTNGSVSVLYRGETREEVISPDELSGESLLSNDRKRPNSKK